MVHLSSCHKSLFPRNIYVHRWSQKHSVTVSSICGTGQWQDLSTYEKLKLFAWTAYRMINIPLDDKGKQNELVCEGSSQPRGSKTWIAVLTKYP